MKTPIGTAHGWLSVQPDGSLQFRPLSSAPGPWEMFDFPGFSAPAPSPTPTPPDGDWLGIPPTQSADYVAQVKAYLQTHGADLSGPCGAFAITQNVAWGLRAHGYGLLDKPSGNNCQGYATDIVMQNNGSGDIVDILGDGGNANVPQWSTSDTVDPARWRPAVEP